MRDGLSNPVWKRFRGLFDVAREYIRAPGASFHSLRTEHAQCLSWRPAARVVRCRSCVCRQDLQINILVWWKWSRSRVCRIFTARFECIAGVNFRHCQSHAALESSLFGHFIGWSGSTSEFAAVRSTGSLELSISGCAFESVSFGNAEGRRAALSEHLDAAGCSKSFVPRPRSDSCYPC